MKSNPGRELFDSLSSRLHSGQLAEDVERLVGKAAAMAGTAAVAIGAFEKQAPDAAQRLNKDLLRTLEGATHSAGKLLKSTRKYLRKHPWQSAALVAAVGVASAVAAATQPDRRPDRQEPQRAGSPRARAKASGPGRTRPASERVSITEPARQGQAGGGSPDG